MSKSPIPEVRINFSWLFYDDVSKKIAELKGWKIASPEKCEEWIEAYRKAWKEKEQAVLTGLQEATDLSFYLKTIDITAVPSVIPKSHPFLINFLREPENITDLITHELTHTLLCDNNVLSIYGDNRNYKLSRKWQELFGPLDDWTALVHIPVHAINQVVFSKYLDDSGLLERDRELCKRNKATSYIKAWDYVEKHDADKIVAKIKRSYQEIAKELDKSNE